MPGKYHPFFNFHITFVMQSTNSLLLNFWALNSNILDDSAGFEILRYLFNKCPAVNYVFWVCSENVMPPDFLANHFTKLNLSKRNVIDPSKDPLAKQFVYFIHRSKALPQLQVREARMEDNDDLLPILQSSNPNIANGQEEYFLANLIQSQDSRNKFFVGVHKNRPVGMLATSLDINAELLSRVFDLDGYTGLVTMPESKVESRLHVTLLLGEPDSLKELNVRELCKQANTVWIDGDRMRHSNAAIKSAGDFVDALQTQISSVSSTAPGASRGCVVTGFPCNEPQARALLTSLTMGKIIVDAVLELQRSDDAGDDQEDADEAVGDLLDAIEMLREPFTAADGYSEDLGASVGNVAWRKIMVEIESKDVDDLALVELKALLDAFDEQLEILRQSNQQGPSTNAFAISLFSIDEKFESRSEDLLRVAFEEYADLDYCILMVPNATLPSAALTHGMQCPRIKEGVSFDQSLYLIHRHALLAHDHLQVVRLNDDHLAMVDGALDSLDPDVVEAIMACVKRSLRDKDVELVNNPAEVAFSVMLENNLVGVVCVSRKLTTSEDITAFRENYQLEDIVSYERHRARAQAMITHWVLNPIFSKWSRFIMREIMRQYCKTLFYFLGTSGVKPCNDVIEEMRPVRVRNRAYAMPHTVRADRGEVAESSTEFDRPMYIMLKKDIVTSKSVVSKRVVVVGGNMSAFAIIEHICMRPDLHVHNIFLVMDSPPSLWKTASELAAAPVRGEDETRLKDNYSGCLSPKDVNEYTERELNALGIAHRVTLIQGKLSDIDRRNRAIIVSDEVIVEYDVLILASGLQDVSYKQCPSLASLHPSNFPERGIFCLGSFAVDELAVAHLKREGLNPSNKSASTNIVVYGDGVRALTAIGRLEELGVDLGRVIWITREETIGDLGVDEVSTNHGCFNWATGPYSVCRLIVLWSLVSLDQKMERKISTNLSRKSRGSACSATP